MRINLCTPTRGKRDSVLNFVGESISHSVLDSTRVVLGFDDDIPEACLVISDKIAISMAKREDSLGAKYNRCADYYPADLYIMGVDDVAIATPGWDRILAETAEVFTDGIGFIYFGKEPHGEDFPSMIVVTERAVDLIGFFCPPYFPFWWNNTWIDEIAQLCGRIVDLRLTDGIITRYPKDGEWHEPARRDIIFWAEFFDVTRPLRIETAQRIIAASDTPDWRKRQMRDWQPQLLAWLLKRNSSLRDPVYAEWVAKVKAPLDARHLRLRVNALRLLESLEQKAA